MIWTEQLLTAGQNLPMPFQHYIRVHLLFIYTSRRVAYPKGRNANTPTKWVLLAIKPSGSWLDACGVNVNNRSVFNLCRLCLCRITPRILSSRRLIETTKVSRCQSWVRMRFGAGNISELYSCSEKAIRTILFPYCKPKWLLQVAAEERQDQGSRITCSRSTSALEQQWSM